MKQFFALFVARNKEFFRDKASMGWNFVFPFLVILGFAYGYSGKNQDQYKVGVYRTSDASAEGAKSFLETRFVKFVPMETLEGGVDKVSRHQIDLFLALGPQAQARYWINSSSPKGYFVEKVLQGSSNGLVKVEVDGKETRYVDWLVPGIMAMNMMFSSLFGVGYVLVRYRKNGVLKRFKATPIGAFQFLAAQVFSRLILILLTSAIFIFGTYALIHFEMRGSWFALFAFLALGAVCMISLGLIVASRSASEELAEGILNLLTWPMMFLSGIWFSLEGASPIVQKITWIFPMTHIVSGSRAIILDGASLWSLAPQIGILATLSLIFLGVGAAIFRWN